MRRLPTIRARAVVAAGALTTIATIALAGCGSGSSGSAPTGAPTSTPPPSGGLSGPSSAPSGSAGGSASIPGGSSSASGSGAPSSSGGMVGLIPCRSVQVHVELTLQPVGDQPPNPTRALLALTNTGHSPCTTFGYPGIAGSDADGMIVGETAHSSRVAKPGPPVRVVVRPGQSAFAGVRIVQGGACENVVGAAVTPPDDTRSVPATIVDAQRPGQKTTLEACSFTVGTLRPSKEGVVF